MDVGAPPRAPDERCVWRLGQLTGGEVLLDQLMDVEDFVVPGVFVQHPEGGAGGHDVGAPVVGQQVERGVEVHPHLPGLAGRLALNLHPVGQLAELRHQRAALGQLVGVRQARAAVRRWTSRVVRSVSGRKRG